MWINYVDWEIWEITPYEEQLKRENIYKYPKRGEGIVYIFGYK